ncbi:L-proline glycine betaine ABC transport system permease protein ProV [Paramixta manurensis]|uniref:L-proline glycine betaine ABC transport system permease protein ProV n=1 Tax=Paramixta manurensis TaxID=2740817 RepID=A0A6M8U6U6_9GAMM|nr:L-proline glycine betaine ABC transport system permease protein ProV [Erwiniaceae bacterium PD-1]
MIRLENLTRRYPGSQHAAVNRLSLNVRQGEFCVFVGPSGCGKTTTLRMINQLDLPDEGRVLINEVPVEQSDVITLRRRIGFVMQHAALFPHRTVAGNIATVPRLLGWKRARIKQRIEELVALMGLETAMLDRYPHQLSGGQQGRVSLARALAADPPILLMDEPFAAVDPVVRQRLQGELLDLQQRLHKTIILVTHDIDEAIRLGDNIAIFRHGGELVQYDSPARILAAPADAFVERFIGPDPTLKRLGLLQVTHLPRHDVPLVDEALRPIETAWPTLPSAWRLVIDQQQRPLYWLSVHGERLAVSHTIGGRDTLRQALAALVHTPTDLLLHLDEQGRYQGGISTGSLRHSLNGPQAVS